MILSQFEKQLNIKFKNQDLLHQALIHRSYLNECPNFRLGHNERLEFLGDAVLEIVVTEYLFHHFPDTAEGELTNWRASLVNSNMLAEVAEAINLENYIYLSKGEAKDQNSKARKYIIANAVEALIGAIYLDQGIRPAKKFITQNFISRLDLILENQLYLDPKSHFQEKSQKVHNTTPHYKVLSESGPDHSKTFEVGLYLDKELISKGKGSSKQEAQVKSAEKGLQKKGWKNN
ncbi:ribonuclease III [Patescibacteria group bacterium]|nr:ribonuclease III [Patescibacteria group bacterium]